MTFEIALSFLLLIGALVVFTLDRFPIDLVALTIMVVILLLGPILNIKPEEAISGFSNPATLTVLAMFILSAGIERTGIVNMLAHRMMHFSGGSEARQLLAVILVVGIISAFINNTAAVAILMPVVVTMARAHKNSPSKLLMPLSYFSQLAGVMTLIGTSTNVVASAMLAQAGYHAYGMFEFTPIGILVFITGSLYFLTVGRHLLPERRTEPEITQTYHLVEFLSEVRVRRNSPLVGKNLAQNQMRERYDIHVFEIFRNGQKLAHPLMQHALQPDDLLFIKSNREQLLKIQEAAGLEPVSSDPVSDMPTLTSGKFDFLEAVIGPNSELIGQRLESCNFHYRYGCTVIAIQKHGETIQQRLGDVQLDLGDALLLRGFTRALQQVRHTAGLIVTEELKIEEFRTEKAPLALAIVAVVVLLAALDFSILTVALTGSVLMVFSGCLKMNELHDAIRLDVLFLLAGVIPLGLALERSGASALVADLAAQAAVFLPPLLVLTFFYMVAMILTELISNNATVIVLAPVGIVTAVTLGMDPRAFVLTIMFAASTSFSTPVGYQTNTMIYGPGGYKFLDFLRVGGPLNLTLAVVTPVFIYLLWGV